MAKNYITAGVLGSLKAKNACCVEILFHQLTATILILTVVGGGEGSEGDLKIIFPYGGGRGRGVRGTP